MKRFVIEFRIEDIGNEGEVEGYIESTMLFVSERIYNKFKSTFKKQKG